MPILGKVNGLGLTDDCRTPDSSAWARWCQVSEDVTPRAIGDRGFAAACPASRADGAHPWGTQSLAEPPLVYARR